MKHFNRVLCLIMFMTLSSCNGQVKSNKQTNTKNNTVGGRCDGCEIMYTGIPDKVTATHTSAGWNEAGQKLVVEGTVFKPDGKTPASDILIYYWQTDNTGTYTKTEKEKTAHGRLRGWVKTGENGTFSLYTVRPKSYPNSTIPAHIHFLIKEPNRNEYYIDDLLFDDDPFLTQTERSRLQNRGGNGIAKARILDNVHYIKRDIILGRNIPEYP